MWGALSASAICAAACVIALFSLLARQSTLSAWDALAVVAATSAVLGHTALVGLLLAVLRGRAHPRHLKSSTLRFVAWASVLMGVVGGCPMLRPRLISGVPVEALFEFSLVAALFALPGMTLLILHEIVRQNRSEPRASEFATFEDNRTPGAGRRESAIDRHSLSHDDGPGDRNADPANLRSKLAPPRRDFPPLAPFLIDVGFSYPVANITVLECDKRRQTTPAIELDIARIWEAEQALAASEGRRLYDGKLLRLCSHRSVSTQLTLELGPTCFREFLGTNARIEAGESPHGDQDRANPLGISAVVVSRDGYLSIGRRIGGSGLHAGYLHTFGGFLEDTDRTPGGAIDVAGAMQRELLEELNIRGDRISDILVTGLVRDRRIQQPELLFDVTVNHTRDELRHLFSTVVEQEHSTIEFVYDDPDSLVAWLDAAVPLAPVAEAALLLHGRHSWGTEWFEQTCFLRYGVLV